MIDVTATLQPTLITRAIRGGIKKALNKSGADLSFEAREDLCSTAWIRLLEYSARINVQHPASLAYRISYFLTLRCLRRTETLELTPEMEAALVGAVSAEEDQITREDAVAELKSRYLALARLKDVERAVLMTRYRRLQTPRDLRPLPDSRVRQQESRALAQLRKHKMALTVER